MAASHSHPSPPSPDPADATRAFWERRAGRTVSELELRQWRQTLVDFFKILQEWAAVADGDADAAPPNHGGSV